jgi:hypothetical protein
MPSIAGYRDGTIMSAVPIPRRLPIAATLTIRSAARSDGHLPFLSKKDGGRMASAGRNEPARAAWLGSLSRRGCDPAGSWRRLKSAPVPPAASAMRPNLAPISRPIMMPSVASAKVVPPIASAATRIFALIRASVTPIAMASMLVPMAVPISTAKECYLGLCCPSARCTLSQIILPPIAPSTEKAIQ